MLLTIDYFAVKKEDNGKYTHSIIWPEKFRPYLDHPIISETDIDSAYIDNGWLCLEEAKTFAYKIMFKIPKGKVNRDRAAVVVNMINNCLGVPKSRLKIAAYYKDEDVIVRMKDSKIVKKCNGDDCFVVNKSIADKVKIGKPISIEYQFTLNSEGV